MPKIRSLAALSALIAVLAAPAVAQETIRMTVATGHPEQLLWVKHIKQTFIPTLDAELAKTGEVRIEWTEAYGGLLVKLGSELDAFQQGIADVTQFWGVFDPARLGTMNVSVAMPFGPLDLRMVAEAADSALVESGVLAEIEEENGVVYLGSGLGVETYAIASKEPLANLSDMNGKKIGAAPPALPWFANSGAVGVAGSYVSYYNDLRTGVVDAVLAGLTAYIPAKLYEVAPYWNEVETGAQYIGGLGVAKGRWDSFSDATKDAFRKAAAAYRDAFFAELDARYEAGLKILADNGGKQVAFDPASRSKWIAEMPNPTTNWIKAAEARGENGRAVLEAYRKALTKKGFEFERDYLAE